MKNSIETNGQPYHYTLYFITGKIGQQNKLVSGKKIEISEDAMPELVR